MSGDRRPLSRAEALVEVLLCSDFPTQIALAQIFALAGFRPHDSLGQLQMEYIVALSLADAALLIALVIFFLRLHGERAGTVFAGRRSPAPEAALGLVLIPVMFGVAIVVLGLLQRFFPGLHNLPRNPLEDLIGTPRDAVVLGFVAVLSGGVREELQRAFIIHRFEQRLGGAVLGIVLFSLAFGAGHLIQGRDVAVTTILLGACWGTVYWARRSAIAPVVSHSGFNAAEIFRYTWFGGA